MLLFHGTQAVHLGSILKRGLVLPGADDWQSYWWSRELGLPPSEFLATRPRCGRSSDPLTFARHGLERQGIRHARASIGDGYIVVLQCPWPVLEQSVRGIWPTWAVDFYHDSRDAALSGYLEACGGSFGEEGGPYGWAMRQRPDLAAVLVPGTGNVERNPAWLWERRLPRPDDDCQITAGPLGPECIIDAVRVFDCRSGRLVPEFDPKRQKKLKHKRRSFASLFLHQLGLKH